MKLTCPICNSDKLTPQLHDITVYINHSKPEMGMVVAKELEYYRCGVCEADPVFPDQIKRNEEKIRLAKEAGCRIN